MKKLCMLFILAIGFAFAFGLNANAETEVNNTEIEQVVNVVDAANDLIDLEIEKAIEKEAKLTHDETYDQELDQIINDLIEKTNEISASTIAFGEKFGVEVICYYVSVEIGDRVVLIDPLRVHDW